MATLKTLVEFSPAEGTYPEASLIANAAGDLFGTTGVFGGYAGTAFEIVYANGTYASTPTTLVDFSYGLYPHDVLLANGTGDLFGTTQSGGANDAGIVFEIANTSSGYAGTPSTLVNFNGTDGETPAAGVITDSAGDLFGTTEIGGANGDGVVFEIVNTSTGYASTPTTLVSFNGANGNLPYSGLIADATGDMFGATAKGGANDDGTVYEIAHTATGYASTPATLVTFTGSNGSDPASGLIADAAGDLFGTAEFGGANGDGSVYEIPYVNGSYASTPTTLINFDGTHGAGPVTSLLADAAGDLFGTTLTGGTDDDGTVYEIANTSTGYATTPTVLINFDGENGETPWGGLIADAAGDLYGTTASGGSTTDTYFGGTVFELMDTGFVPCFLAGTRIATLTGEVPVETLSAGDLVVTLSGEVKPIIWLGVGRTLVTPRNRCDVSPVIVRRHALAENIPNRDLYVTRPQAILIGDVLVPVEHLINGVSVVWDDAARVVEYYHIELDAHDVLLANGAPAESFRDDDSRQLFQNEAGHPRRLTSTSPCRPIVDDGPRLEQAWREVASRIGPLPVRRWTRDPDLHLMMDGCRIDPTSSKGEVKRFSIDRPRNDICVVSRTCIPSVNGSGEDRRRLGVGVEGLTIFHPAGRQSVPISGDDLTAGFHPFEGHIRWTKGRAILPASLFARMRGRIDFELRLAGELLYPLDIDQLSQKTAGRRTAGKVAVF